MYLYECYNYITNMLVFGCWVSSGVLSDFLPERWYHLLTHHSGSVLCTSVIFINTICFSNMDITVEKPSLSF